MPAADTKRPRPYASAAALDTLEAARGLFLLGDATVASGEVTDIVPESLVERGPEDS